MKKIYILLVLFSLSWINYVSAEAGVPTGRSITIDNLLDLGRSLGGFLLVAGGILATITIIATGIMYLSAGSNTQRLASAKGMFKAGIIGALIIFGAGLIINTVGDFAQDPLNFFGGGGGGGGQQGTCVNFGGWDYYCVGGPNDGSVCIDDSNC